MRTAKEDRDLEAALRRIRPSYDTRADRAEALLKLVEQAQAMNVMVTILPTQVKVTQNLSDSKEVESGWDMVHELDIAMSLYKPYNLNSPSASGSVPFTLKDNVLTIEFKTGSKSYHFYRKDLNDIEIDPDAEKIFQCIPSKPRRELIPLADMRK